MSPEFSGKTLFYFSGDYLRPQFVIREHYGLKILHAIFGVTNNYLGGSPETPNGKDASQTVCLHFFKCSRVICLRVPRDVSQEAY